MNIFRKFKEFIVGRSMVNAIDGLTDLGYVVHATKDSIDMHVPYLTCSICCSHCSIPYNHERFTALKLEKLKEWKGRECQACKTNEKGRLHKIECPRGAELT